MCLVGRNGSGKSTLLRIAAGLIEPDHGTRFVQPGATIRYLPQEPDFSGAATTLAYVEAGLAPGDDVHQARYLLEQLGLDGSEEPERLSGGEARRAALARVLAPAPDILLLDEPTNHLDLPAIEWLERELGGGASAVVMISHDRRFLANLSRSTVWLDRGITRRIERGFADFEAWRDDVLAEEEREQHKLDRRIVAEEDWLRYGVTARRKRNVRRLGSLHALRQARRDYRGAAGKAVLDRFRSGHVRRTGDRGRPHRQIATTGGRSCSDFSTRILRGDRIGIIGPNGSRQDDAAQSHDRRAPSRCRHGAARHQPCHRHARTGPREPRAHRDRCRDAGRRARRHRDDRRTAAPRDRLHEGLSVCARAGAHARSRVLSGGERGRLMLARALAKPSNVLVLDEPTNDLDLETLDVLEEMLADYPGTILLISHDRDFLDRVVDAVIAPDGGARWVEFAGGYSDMLAQRGADLAREPTSKPAVKEAQAPRETKPEAKSGKRRLSFHEKHSLETLPATIAALQSKTHRLQTQLADPTLYARDRRAFEEASAALVAAQAELAAARRNGSSWRSCARPSRADENSASREPGHKARPPGWRRQ